MMLSQLWSPAKTIILEHWDYISATTMFYFCYSLVDVRCRLPIKLMFFLWPTKFFSRAGCLLRYLITSISCCCLMLISIPEYWPYSADNKLNFLGITGIHSPRQKLGFHIPAGSHCQNRGTGIQVIPGSGTVREYSGLELSHSGYYH